MNKKIVVAGAGHGGIVCAALLAEKGFDVTVYEKNKLQDIGMDQTDTFMSDCFDFAGITRPPKEFYQPSLPLCFTNPSATVRIRMKKTEDSDNCIMDRKFLIKYLIDYASAKGVKFRFNTEIICPVTDSERVLGMTVKNGTKLSCIPADMIIDSAGINSPLRTLMPSRFGIMNNFSDDRIFTCYRAFYKKTEPDFPEDKYTVHFFHNGKPGISWVVSEHDYFDVLIGRFGTKLNDTDIENALNDLRQHYPEISNTMIRGGKVAQIPLRRTIPLIITDGYAAIGDCASMTIPIIGSGIANSIKAGKYLADAILKDKNVEFSSESLWLYQYEYFKNIGIPLVTVDKIRKLCTLLDADDVDFLLEKELLSQNDLNLNGVPDIKTLYIIQKMLKAIPKLSLALSATKTLAEIGTMKKILDSIPQKYDKNAVRDWCMKYEAV